MNLATEFQYVKESTTNVVQTFSSPWCCHYIELTVFAGASQWKALLTFYAPA